MTALHDTTTLASIHGWLQRRDVAVNSCPNVVIYTHDLGSGPVLILLHGNPQSAYMWRHVAGVLKGSISLFIPEIPGYGISAAPNSGIDARSMGNAIVEAYVRIFPGREVIFGGHDRGARICQRIAVDNSHWSEAPRVKLIGCVILDIVSTLDTWKTFDDPKHAVGYPHWAYLSSGMAVPMIQAFGGDRFAAMSLDKVAGTNAVRRQRFQSDKAWEVYKSIFATHDAIAGFCADYKAGALTEFYRQQEELRTGKLIEVPTLLMWSAAFQANMFDDVAALWKKWFRSPESLTFVPVGDGVGHYLPEEAVDEVSESILRFLDQLGVSQSTSE
ncbi:Hypothetical protein D9617_1g086400 [Elsinoe fawcettii]|nr:Hypothetical protein D9617_1g086400 [Elsinoe fawcettii]